MTTEEAIEIIEQDIPCEYDTDLIEALNMAINTLEHPERNVVTVVPCGDTISRQAVIDVIEREQFKGDAVSEIEKLPSVTPERPKGKWEEYGHNLGDNYILVGIRCSNCHTEPPKRDPHKGKSFMNYIKSDFCPKCGADMREVSE